LIIIQDEIYKLATGTAQKGINQENFYNIDILLPSLEDQEKIVKQMGQYDNLVELQKQQIESIDLTIKERFEFHLRKCTESSKELSSVITTDEIKISDKIDLTESLEKSKVKKNKSIVVLEEEKEVKKNKSKVVLEEEEEVKKNKK